MQVEISVAMVISILAIALTIYNTVVGQKRANRSDTKGDATTITTILVKLENIDKGVSRIEAENAAIRGEVRELRDKVIVNEQSLKSAWKHIETIRGDENR